MTQLAHSHFKKPKRFLWQFRFEQGIYLFLIFWGQTKRCIPEFSKKGYSIVIIIPILTILFTNGFLQFRTIFIFEYPLHNSLYEVLVMRPTPIISIFPLFK